MHAPSASSALSALLNLGSAAPGQGKAVQDGLLALEGGQNFQQFMQLLGDMGGQAGGQGAQQFLPGKLLPAQTGTALAAQGLEIKSAEPALNLDQLITKDDASSLLQHFSMLFQHQDGETKENPQAPMIDAIKDQLQQIVQTDTPKTIAQVIEAVPGVKETKIAGMLSNLVQAVKKVAAKQTDSEEEAPHQMLAAMQQLPAMMFRAGHGADTATSAAAPKQKEEKAKTVETVAPTKPTVTVIEPLAFVTTVSAQTVAVPAAQQPQFAAAAPVDARIDQDLLSAPATLDQLIPELAPVASKSEQVNALPEVTLPSMRPAETTTAASALVAANAGPAVDATTKQADKPARAARDEVSSVLSSLNAATALTDTNYVPQMPAHGQLAHIQKTLDLMATPGLVNHASPKEQVHVAITQADKDGLDRITIQLDPAELGRVEVKMHKNSEGVTQISFVVDKPETFDSLSRDARSLERSLQEAGIKADTGSMQFNLRQQPQPQFQSGMNGQGQPSQQQAQADSEDDQSAGSISSVAMAAPLTKNYIINVRDGVDISA